MKNLATPFLHRAVDLQSHLVATLVVRKKHSSLSWDPVCEEDTEPCKEAYFFYLLFLLGLSHGMISICRGGCNTHRLGVLSPKTVQVFAFSVVALQEQSSDLTFKRGPVQIASVRIVSNTALE